MPVSQIAADAWTQEDEGDEQTTEQERLNDIDAADIEDIKANFFSRMDTIVNVYGDNAA